MREMPDYSINRPDELPAKDAVSSILSLLNPHALFSASLITGGDWAIDFPSYEGVKFAAVIRGFCWLAVDGIAEPIRLNEGDCYLLAPDRSYRQASDLSLDATDVRAVFALATDGKATYGESRDTFLIGGRFSFDESQTLALLNTLPPVIHIPAQSPHAPIIPLVLKQLMHELSASEPGSGLMIDHLAHILFVQVLRAYLASGQKPPIGWLGALADPKIGHVLNLMHRNPGRRWTLADLTAATGMSRSVLSARFKALVGTGPLDYLLKWRMQLAAKELRAGNKSMASIAFSLGYGSESAFGNAFKRIMGKAPRRYLRESPAPSHPPGV